MSSILLEFIYRSVSVLFVLCRVSVPLLHRICMLAMSANLLKSRFISFRPVQVWLLQIQHSATTTSALRKLPLIVLRESSAKNLLFCGSLSFSFSCCFLKFLGHKALSCHFLCADYLVASAGLEY